MLYAAPHDVKQPQAGWTPYLLLALVLHVLGLGLLFLPRYREPVFRPDQLIVFRLEASPEGQSPMFMPSTNPQVALPPAGSDSIPDADIKSGGELISPLDASADTVSDAELAEMLAKEREALRAELEQLSQLAAASPTPAKMLPMPPPVSGDQGQAGKGPEGAIRELDLGGYPQSIVDDIMDRYKLKVVTRKMKAGQGGQNFLSSASKGKSERFFGGLRTMEEGIYEVFQLSRDSVAHMSRLEEQALRAKGLEPLKARVIHITFGIVKSESGEYELGVKSLEAEPVQ